MNKVYFTGNLDNLNSSVIKEDNNLKDLNKVEVKKASNDFTFMKSKYNIAKVKTKTDKADQVILIDSAADALIDVKVLAVAFNMSIDEFEQRKIVVDGFGDLDTELITDATYHEFTAAEMTALNQIPLILMSEDFLMIYDNLIEMRDLENGEGLSRNYWLHNWKTLSISPFENAVLFVPGEPTVNSISVTPATATVAPGSTLALQITVNVSNYAPKAVNYASNNDKVTVDASGLVKIAEDATGTATITITSVFDSIKTATVTLTIS